MYRYSIYLVLYILILTLDTVTLKKYAKSPYVNGILLSIITMAIMTGEYITISSIIYSLLVIVMYLLLYKIKNKKKRKNVKIDIKKSKEMPIGFYLGISNILVILVVLLYLKLMI